jgi:hypothetical protein
MPIHQQYQTAIALLTAAPLDRSLHLNPRQMFAYSECVAIAYRFVESLPHETPLKRLERRTLSQTLSTKGFNLSKVTQRKIEIPSYH